MKRPMSPIISATSPHRSASTWTPRLPCGENIDKLFKRHHKAGRGRSIVERQLGDVRSRKATISEQTRRLDAIRDWDTWLAVANRIEKRKGSSVHREGPIRFQHGSDSAALWSMAAKFSSDAAAAKTTS